MRPVAASAAAAAAVAAGRRRLCSTAALCPPPQQVVRAMPSHRRWSGGEREREQEGTGLRLDVARGMEAVREAAAVHVRCFSADALPRSGVEVGMEGCCEEWGEREQWMTRLLSLAMGTRAGRRAFRASASAATEEDKDTLTTRSESLLLLARDNADCSDDKVGVGRIVAMVEMCMQPADGVLLPTWNWKAVWEGLRHRAAAEAALERAWRRMPSRDDLAARAGWSHHSLLAPPASWLSSTFNPHQHQHQQQSSDLHPHHAQQLQHTSARFLHTARVAAAREKRRLQLGHDPDLEPYVANLCVLPSHRGRAIGRFLMQACEAIASQVWGQHRINLHVDAADAPVVQLYTDMNYVPRQTPHDAQNSASMGGANIRLHSKEL